MSTPVAVIVRTHNRPQFLTRALASVAGQSCTDYELIIVNDAGHREGVERVIEDADETLRQRIRVVHNEVSHGREAALESGLAVTDAPYFAVHDDDDTWDPQFLARTLEYLEAHPEAGAVSVRTDVIFEHITDTGAIVEDRRVVLAQDEVTASIPSTFVANYMPPISQLVRRAAADEVGHWDGSFRTQADWDFNVRLMAAWPVGFLNAPVLAHWHQRSTSEGAAANSIVSDATAHKIDHAEIRESYIRQALRDTPGGIGQALLQAEYFRRTEEKIDGVNASLHDALRLSRVERDEHVAALSTRIDYLEHQLQVLHDSLSLLHSVVPGLVETIGAMRSDQLQEINRRHPARRVVNKVKRSVGSSPTATPPTQS